LKYATFSNRGQGVTFNYQRLIEQVINMESKVEVIITIVLTSQKFDNIDSVMVPWGSIDGKL
jgi:hypothetical protein